MADFKVGDRVRVTIEGDLNRQDNRTVEVRAGKSFVSIHNWDEDPSAVTVEKIEPPVGVFEPGDIVQDRGNPEWKYVLTSDGGYTELDTGNHYRDGCFTSENYEQISLW